MRFGHAIKLAIATLALGILVTATAHFFGGLTAQATPKIANGQPCSNCHSGNPPSKQNLKH